MTLTLEAEIYVMHFCVLQYLVALNCTQWQTSETYCGKGT